MNSRKYDLKKARDVSLSGIPDEDAKWIIDCFSGNKSASDLINLIDSYVTYTDEQQFRRNRAMSKISLIIRGIYELNDIGEADINLNTIIKYLDFKDFHNLVYNKNISEEYIEDLKFYLYCMAGYDRKGEANDVDELLTQHFDFDVMTHYAVILKINDEIKGYLNMINEREVERERIRKEFSRIVLSKSDIDEVKKCLSGDYGSLALTNLITILLEQKSSAEVWRWRSRDVINLVIRSLVDLKNAGDIIITSSVIREYLTIDGLYEITMNKNVSEENRLMVEKYLNDIPGSSIKDLKERKDTMGRQLGFETIIYFDILDVLGEDLSEYPAKEV